MASPRFSFSGWNSFSLAPKVNPASMPTPILRPPGTPTPASRSGIGVVVPSDLGPGVAPVTDTRTGGALGPALAQTSAANPNLPAWLQAEVDRINAQQALRTQLAGQVTGGQAAQAFDPNMGIAAVTNAQANYNAQINQMNEQARLANLVQQRSSLTQNQSPFGFTNPFDVNRILGLGNQIQSFQNVNLPLAAGAASGQRRNASGWLSSLWA